MAIYCIDDGGDGSQTNTTHSTTVLDWSKADVSIADLLSYDAAALTTNGNVIYFGSDTVQTQASALTITGVTTGRCIFISADNTQATPTFQEATTNQIETTGANNITLAGGISMFGMRIACGQDLVVNSQTYPLLMQGGRIVLGAGRSISPAGGSSTFLIGTAIDLTADGTTNRSANLLTGPNYGRVVLDQVSFINPGYRTGYVVTSPYNNGGITANNIDFSGFTGITLSVFQPNVGSVYAANCVAPAGKALVLTSQAVTGLNEMMLVNCETEKTGQALSYYSGTGNSVVSTPAIYRSSGAAIEGVATGWLVTTGAYTSEAYKFSTPWIYGLVSSAGSKTFDLFIVNNTADFTDAEVWLEVEYLGTADEAIMSKASDQRATITATPAAQTDDTTSVWNGTGPSFTYKQKLSVTATVAETGQYRARVCVGVASIASSRYFYVDPKVTVS